MNVNTLRKWQLGLSVAWLIVILVPYLVGEMGLPFLAFGLVALFIYWVLPKSKRAGRVARSAAASRELFDVAISSPSAHYADRTPVPLSVLAELLTMAELGTVGVAGDALQVTAPNGQRVELRARSPHAVVRSQLTMRANAFHLAALCADAIAPKVGPVRIEADGLALDIDGTQPRSDLEYAIRDQQLSRVAQIRTELRN